MNDWRSRVNMSRRDGYKAAAAVLGLLFLLIFVGWVLSRFLRHETPPPVHTPVAPAVPALPKP
jgi:hypothetical protein